uniref:Uncharacterized protein n=1 Tax=Arundo donax TaxID=35708 RepID=A0A0A9H5I7_ARUDO
MRQGRLMQKHAQGSRGASPKDQIWKSKWTKCFQLQLYLMVAMVLFHGSEGT